MTTATHAQPALAVLTVAADQCNWQTDAKLIFLSGYLSQTVNGLDPEKFADATAIFLRDSGLPPNTVVDFLCSLVDKVDANGDPNGFANFIAEIMKAQPPAEGDTASTPEAIPTMLQIGMDNIREIKQWLSQSSPIEDHAGGTVLAHYPVELSDAAKSSGLSMCLDIVNSEQGPLVDMFAMRGRTLVASWPPHKELRDTYYVELEQETYVITIG